MSIRKSLLKVLTYGLMSAVLGACMGMPVKSMLAMRKLDPLEADPAHISLAVITHQAVTLPDGAVSIALGYVTNEPDSTFFNISIAQIVTEAIVSELQAFKKPDESITLFYLDEGAADAMRDAQNRIKIAKQQGLEGQGSVSVAINSACFTQSKPDILNASIYMRFDPDGDYLLMNSNIDLNQISEQEENQGFWKECDAQTAEIDNALRTTGQQV